MFYLSGSSVRTAVDFLIKMVGKRFRLVKTEKVMASKTLKFVGINMIISSLIMSRRMLTCWQEFKAMYIELRMIE